MSPNNFDTIDHHYRRRKESGLEKFFRFLAMLLIIICPIILIVCFRVVKQYKRAVVLRFGRIRKDSPAGPGIIFVNIFTDDITLVDIRTQSLNLPPQSIDAQDRTKYFNCYARSRVIPYQPALFLKKFKILTKDSVTASVDAIVYFHVTHPVNCILNCQFYSAATELITTAILRTTLGQYSLTEMTENRENISVETMIEIERVTAAWGVHIERVEIKDILLPSNLQKALAAEAKGRRTAKAKLIEADGEIKTAEYLREAARLMAENPKVLLLRYLQTMNSISTEQETTVLFPFPLELPE